MKARLLVLLLLAPVAAGADTLDVLVVASAGADVATTEWALRQPGLAEANPLMSTPAARVGLKTVATATVIVGTHELANHGHKRAAKVLKVLAILFWTGAATNNALQAGRR